MRPRVGGDLLIERNARPGPDIFKPAYLSGHGDSRCTRSARSHIEACQKPRSIRYPLFYRHVCGRPRWRIVRTTMIQLRKVVKTTRQNIVKKHHGVIAERACPCRHWYDCSACLSTPSSRADRLMLRSQRLKGTLWIARGTSQILSRRTSARDRGSFRIAQAFDTGPGTTRTCVHLKVTLDPVEAWKAGRQMRMPRLRSDFFATCTGTQAF